MHGRNRSDYKRLQRDPENAAKLAHKASQWHTLSNELLRRRQQQDTSSTTLALIDKLLTVNPDPLYLWNHRREIFSKKPEAFDYSTELILTQTALQNNPKAYGPWFHRKWVLQQLFLRENNNDNVEQDVDIDFTSVLEEERALIAQLLTADERNFHGWNYRRFLVSCQLALEQTDGSIPNGSWWNNTLKEDAEIIESFSLMGAQIAASDSTSSSRQIMAPPLNYPDVLQQEWNYSLDKIVSNFSNASALYFRSQLLPLLVALKDQDEEEDDDDDDHSFALHRIIPMELELVENAVFTEPDEYVHTFAFRIYWRLLHPALILPSTLSVKQPGGIKSFSLILSNSSRLDPIRSSTLPGLRNWLTDTRKVCAS
jgi:hypothetical protein